jgi:ribosomal protein S18 acetylase RimI-like enzyme
MSIRRIRRDEAGQLRAVRLRALCDSPDAFGAVHSDEARLPGGVWVDRAVRSDRGQEEITLVADDGARLVGMVVGRLAADDPSHAGLFGLWVEPACRGSGIGTSLTEGVVEWARTRKAERLTLWAVESNGAAIRLCNRAGFNETGQRKSLGRDPSIVVVEMTRHLSQSTAPHDTARSGS